LRIVALRTSANLSVAAARLGMAPVSLARWLDRRPQLWTVKAGWRR
jgi:ActR/RegA family two-component response regulator